MANNSTIANYLLLTLSTTGTINYKVI